jgi:hypothetical protein
MLSLPAIADSHLTAPGPDFGERFGAVLKAAGMSDRSHRSAWILALSSSTRLIVMPRASSTQSNWSSGTGAGLPAAVPRFTLHHVALSSLPHGARKWQEARPRVVIRKQTRSSEATAFAALRRPSYWIATAKPPSIRHPSPQMDDSGHPTFSLENSGAACNL